MVMSRQSAGEIIAITSLNDPTTPAHAFKNLLRDLETSSAVWLEPNHQGVQGWSEANGAGLVDAIRDLFDQSSATVKGNMMWKHGFQAYANLLEGWQRFESGNSSTYENHISRFLDIKNRRLAEYERSGHIDGTGFIRILRIIWCGEVAKNHSECGIGALNSAGVIETTLDYWYHSRDTPQSTRPNPTIAESAHVIMSSLDDEGSERVTKWAPPTALREGLIGLLEHAMQTMDLDEFYHLFALCQIIGERKHGLHLAFAAIGMSYVTMGCLWSLVQSHPGSGLPLANALDAGLKWALSIPTKTRGLTQAQHSHALIKSQIPSLFAKVLYLHQLHKQARSESEQHFKEIVSLIVSTLKPNSQAVEQTLKPVWLPTLDRLQDLQPGGSTASVPQRTPLVIASWLELGSGLGLVESRMRDETQAEDAEACGSCSWYQCIFHGGFQEGARRWIFLDDKRREGFRYCSTACQKLYVVGHGHSADLARVLV